MNCNSSIFVELVATDDFVVENEEGYYAAGDGCVGKVEDRGEKDAVLSGVDGHPCRHFPFDEREVEHVNNTSVKEFSVSVSVGLKVCDLGKGRVVEDESVEEAVDDVACRSCRDKGEADYIASWSSALNLAVDKPSDEAYSDDAEEGEEEFASPEFPSECHTVVLDENETEPAGDFDALSQIHARLDTDLDNLVYDKNGHEEGDGKDMFVLPCHKFLPLISNLYLSQHK